MDDPQATYVWPSTFEPLRLRMQPGGHAIDLNGPDLLFGRHSEADLCMPLPDVSRRHCRFVYSAEGWEMIDLGSLNGVYVNGERVERAMLRPGDTLKICSLQFEVEGVIPEAERMLGEIATALPLRKSA